MVDEIAQARAKRLAAAFTPKTAAIAASLAMTAGASKKSTTNGGT